MFFLLPAQGKRRGVAYKGERDDGLESSSHDCGVTEVVRSSEEIKIGYKAVARVSYTVSQ